MLINYIQVKKLNDTNCRGEMNIPPSYCFFHWICLLGNKLFIFRRVEEKVKHFVFLGFAF